MIVLSLERKVSLLFSSLESTIYTRIDIVVTSFLDQLCRNNYFEQDKQNKPNSGVLAI